jgi:hypothetical protein
MNLKKIGKVFTSKFVGPGPSSYKKIIYRAAVSQRLRNTALDRAATGIGTTGLLVERFTTRPGILSSHSHFQTCSRAELVQHAMNVGAEMATE